MKNSGIIYGLICPLIKKIKYIGQTRQKLNKRLSKHIWTTKNKIKNKKKLNYKENWIYKLIKLNLVDNIEIIEIEICDSEKLNDKEIFWIDFYKKQGNKLTNLSKGGNNFYNEEKLKKISELNKILKKNNKYNLGKKHSEKTKNKISESLKKSNHPLFGISKPEYIRKKISKANSGEKNGMYGKKFKMSDEHKNKISESLKKSKKFQDSRKSKEYRKKISLSQSNIVFLLNLKFELIKQFNNMSECSKFLNCKPENVYNARRDKRKICKQYWVVYPSDYEQLKKEKNV